MRAANTTYCVGRSVLGFGSLPGQRHGCTPKSPQHDGIKLKSTAQVLLNIFLNQAREASSTGQRPERSVKFKARFLGVSTGVGSMAFHVTVGMSKPFPTSSWRL